MKPLNNAILILAYSALASSAAAPSSNQAHAEAVCGELGVFDISSAPEGVDPSKVRLCADHPEGRNRILDPEKGASLAPESEGSKSDLEERKAPVEAASELANPLSERSCEKSAPYGCSKGYCWKICGQNSEWCWTARNGGTGDWRGCNTWHDCGTKGDDNACGKNCSDPKVCGCSC